MPTLPINRTNRAINPGANVALTGWNTNDGSKYPITLETGSDRISGAGCARTIRQGTLSADVASVWFNGISSATTGLTVTPGQQISASVDVKVQLGDRRIQNAYFQYRDASNVNLSQSPAYPTTLLDAGVAKRINVTHTVPALAAYALFVVSIYTIVGGGNAVAGEKVWYDNLVIGPSGSYFDGDSLDTAAFTYEWAGAVNASESIERARPARVLVPTSTNPRLQRRGWRYFATRLNGDGTETMLDMDLPLEDVSIEDVLSGDCSLNAKIEPVYSRLIGTDGLPLLREWSTAIYAENDGDIRSGGILTSSGFDGPSWSIEATGFTSYGRDMPYVGGGYKGIHVDPIDVMRTIWTHIQTQPGGNIGLTFDTTTTGGKVDIGTELKQVEFDTKSGPVSFESGPYKLNFYTNHDLQGDVDDLAAETPFDYHERHYWDGNIIRHRVDIGYPRIGRRRTDLRFVHGVNIFDPVMVERNGELYASGTMVLGAGEGASMIKSIREPPTRPAGRLRRISVVVDDTIKSVASANKRADAENQWRARLDDIESVLVRDHPNAPLGAVKVGDEIRIEGQGDWVSVDMWVRVLSVTYQPADGRIAEYSVTRTDKLTS